MRGLTKLAGLVLAGALALTGCGGGSTGTGTDTSSSGSSGSSSMKVGLAFDVGGRGDKSFNDAAAAGLDKAKSEIPGLTTKELSPSQGESDAQKEERLRLLAQAGYNPVVAVGFAYAPALKKVAPSFPKTSFAIVDDSSFDAPNVANLVFAEEQGSFLVGAAAALKSTTGSVAFVGGVNTPLLQKFQAGFDAGAKAAKPGIKLQAQYLSQPPDYTGFADPAKGRTAAQGLYDSGADVVFAAAGGSGTGVFEAAKSSGELAIGVDSDQYLQVSADLKPVIMTSMIKRVDTAVYDFVKSAQQGKPLVGVQEFDLAKGGVGYSTSNTTSTGVTDLVPQLDKYKQQIISGQIKVPTTP